MVWIEGCPACKIAPTFLFACMGMKEFKVRVAGAQRTLLSWYLPEKMTSSVHGAQRTLLSWYVYLPEKMTSSVHGAQRTLLSWYLPEKMTSSVHGAQRTLFSWYLPEKMTAPTKSKCFFSFNHTHTRVYGWKPGVQDCTHLLVCLQCCNVGNHGNRYDKRHPPGTTSGHQSKACYPINHELCHYIDDVTHDKRTPEKGMLSHQP
jgi:hypothetical protein